MKYLSIIFTFMILASGCGLATTRPKLEMSLAQEAFIAAKDAKADELSPNLYRKAEIFYLRAKSAYKRKYFNKAKEYAEASQKFSEQAEFDAVKRAMLDN